MNPTENQKPRLALPSFRRNPKLVPTFSPDVDLWFQHFAQDMYETLCIHTGKFLAWELGPVAAMSFIQAPGAGKGMYVQGLLECLEDYKLHLAATADDLIEKFNDKLRWTPYIFLNEGLQEERGHNHMSDMFRRVVTGDYFRAEGKNRDSTSFRFPFRVVLTANHWRLFDALGEGRDLSSHEHDALGVRLVHYAVKDREAATKLLARMGGRNWTKGWVEDENGESQFIVAKHMLWLYEKYGRTAAPTGSGRLLFEGNPNCAAMDRLRTKGGSTPDVVETLLKILSSNMSTGYGDGHKGVHTDENGKLFVTIGAILDFHRGNVSKGNNARLRARNISMALKGLTVRGGHADGETPISTKNNLAAEWHEIDVPLLVKQTQEYGWECKKLDELLSRQLRVLSVNGNGHAHANGNGHASALYPLPQLQPPQEGLR